MQRSSVLGMRNLRRRLTRFTLTAVGIALGIGVFFAVLVTNATVDAGLNEMLGRRQLPNVRIEAAAGYAAELPRDLVERAARLPGVIDVAGYVRVDMRIPDAPEAQQSTTLYGDVFVRGSVEPPRLPSRGSDIIGEGREPAVGADEIGMSDRLLRDLRIGLGDATTLIGPAGAQRFTVVQTSGRRDGRSTDDRAAWSSYETVRRIAGQSEGAISNGNIRLARQTDVAEWIARYGGDFPGVRLVNAEVDENSLREAFEGPQAALAGLAAVALFVSGFLIFLTLSMSVAEASAMHGTLRAIGASRAQVRRVVLVDAVMLTLLAAPAGIAIGFGVAVGMIRVTREVFGLPSLPVTVPPFGLALAVVVGVVLTLVSAFVPAQRAARMAPVVAIRGTGVERPGSRLLPMFGVVLLVVGVAVAFLVRRARVDAGSFIVLVGAVLAVPLFMPFVTRVAGAATSRLARGVGTVGVLHLRKEPRRAAYTVALIMVVLAMVFTAGAVHLSLRQNLVSTLSQRFPADLFVSAGAAFDADLRAKVVDTPGVGAATDLRFTRIAVDSPNAGLVPVTMVDPGTFFAVQPIPWLDGSDSNAREALTRGGAVAIPASLKERYAVDRGDRIAVMSPNGPVTLRVVGVYKTFDSQSPLLVGAVDGPRIGGSDSAIGGIAIRVEDGRSPATVKTAIERRFAGTSPVFVQLTSASKTAFIGTQTSFFNIVYAFVLIALVMGSLGVTNTLTMAVLRRHREIGVLRAIGTERRQLRRMATVEAATIALAALVLAVPLGMLLSVTVLRTVTDAIGLVVEYQFPWPMFGVAAVATVLVAILSSVVPGRHAARVDPARVLRFD